MDNVLSKLLILQCDTNWLSTRIFLNPPQKKKRKKKTMNHKVSWTNIMWSWHKDVNPRGLLWTTPTSKSVVAFWHVIHNSWGCIPWLDVSSSYTYCLWKMAKAYWFCRCHMQRYSNNTICFFRASALGTNVYSGGNIPFTKKLFLHVHGHNVQYIIYFTRPHPPPKGKATWVKMPHDIVDVVKLLQKIDNELIIVFHWIFN